MTNKITVCKGVEIELDFNGLSGIELDAALDALFNIRKFTRRLDTNIAQFAGQNGETPKRTYTKRTTTQVLPKALKYIENHGGTINTLETPPEFANDKEGWKRLRQTIYGAAYSKHVTKIGMGQYTLSEKGKEVLNKTQISEANP